MRGLGVTLVVPRLLYQVSSNLYRPHAHSVVDLSSSRLVFQANINQLQCQSTFGLIHNVVICQFFWEVSVENNYLWVRVVIKSFIFFWKSCIFVCTDLLLTKSCWRLIGNFLKWLYKAMYICFSRILISMFNNGTGRLFSTSLRSPFLKRRYCSNFPGVAGIFPSLIIFRCTECLMLKGFLLVCT